MGRPREGAKRMLGHFHTGHRAGPCGPSGCGGVGSPGELRAGARSVGLGPGVVLGCAEAGEGVGGVSSCLSWSLACGMGVCEKKRCEYVGVVV